MNYLKKIISTIFLAAIIVGLFLVYKKDRAHLSLENTLPSLTPEQEIKGAQKMNPSDTTYVFTEEEALKRLKISPGNIVWYSNYYRNEEHLPPLIQRKALNNSALAKNNNMLLYHYFDHIQPGSTINFDHFIDDQHYLFIKVGENLAMGDFSTSKEIVDAWMKSPAHKRNILDTTYTEIGVNVQTGTMKGKEVTIITQHFGKPRKSCPTIDEPLKIAITDLGIQIKELAADIGAGNGDYNSLVADYNNSVNRMSLLVEKYNTQIKAFDACVSKGN